MEVRFKATRRELFWSRIEPPLTTGEWVVVTEVIRRSPESPPQYGRGYDIGIVQLTGHLAEARRRSLKRDIPPQQKVLRRPSREELAQLMKWRQQEPRILLEIREMVRELGLDTQHQMKVTDVEFYGDGRSLICYFTADERVDFRELVRRIGEKYKVRPDLRQISAREESGRIGGIGACGRELCCSTWITASLTITAETARYQGLSLNSSKLLGLCGKLKCCLSYELDIYKEISQRIPQVRYLLTDDGEWRYLRTELLLERLWFEKVGEGRQVCLPASAVQEIMEMNAQGQRPPSIEPYAIKFPDLPTRI
ncbi:MAG: regulatory iron-sulfur-containing complex subunit RicT [Bacteroidia bacterium]|nr:Signal peptidase-like protein [Bacteroidia bacterium]MDW8015809.1 regulatory iron-sulfur-containing complex subunit RicT [Bacteroidia bacterium]